MLWKAPTKLLEFFGKQFLVTTGPMASSEHSAVSWDVSLEETAEEKDGDAIKTLSVNGGIRVSDCHRSVYLELYSTSLENVSDRLAKVKVLQDELSAVEAALTACLDKMSVEEAFKH